MRAKLALTLLFFASFGTANAENTAPRDAQSGHASQKEKFEILPFEVADVYNADQAGEVLSKWVKGDRKLASNQSFSESNLSQEFKVIRNKLLLVKTAEDFDARIVELEEGYDKLSDDAKFFAAQMIMLKPLRGIVWRLRPLFEKSSGFSLADPNKAVHSGAVSLLRLVTRATNVYLPTDPANALFQYAVAPNKTMRLSQQFKSVSDFQSFLLVEMYPGMVKASKRVADLFLKSTKMPFVWDNKIMYGQASFEDGIRRYVGFGEPEVAITSGAIQRSLNRMLVFCAYDQEQIINVAGKLAKQSGTDGFSSENLGVTSAERAKILNSFRGKGFLSLKYPNLMAAAHKHLVAAASYTLNAQQVIQNQPNSTATLLNPLFFRAEAQPKLGAGMANLYSTATKKTPVRNVLTGEVVEVDLPSFYAEPPKSLLDLLPTAWKHTKVHEITLKNTAGEKLVYRDYSEGSATEWNASAWTKLFPKLKNGTAVDDAFRTLEYSGGPELLLGGMAGFIF